MSVNLVQMQTNLFNLLYSLIIFFSLSQELIAEYQMIINRVKRELVVTDPNANIILRTSIGIGRGGMGKKKSMADLITPTGDFKVDLILSENPQFNKISSEVRDRYRSNPEYYKLVKDQLGLQKLFSNMNSIDFDQDGKADNAYGVAYIGLDSENVLTGPKLEKYKDKVPYWFSIALHNTPEIANIGQANSGGCVHLKADVILKLIESGILKIGSKVQIVDGSGQY